MSKIQKWKIISEKDISPSPYFPLFVNQVKLPDDRIIEYYVSRLGDSAMTAAITQDKKVVFVRQYKHGVDEITLELPAGRIEDQNPAQAAKNELREETGITADKLEFIGDVFVVPSKDRTVTHGFLLENAQITQQQELDKNENIEVVLIPLAEIDGMIENGEIKTADTIALLKLAKLKRPDFFD